MTHDWHGTRPFFAGLLLAAAVSTSGIASAGEISGILLGEGAAGGEYTLPSAKLDLCKAFTDECQTTFTDSQGGFRFGGIDPGQYDLKTTSKLGGMSSREIELPAGIDGSFLKVITK